jgi:hypothetical protein
VLQHAEVFVKPLLIPTRNVSVKRYAH